MIVVVDIFYYKGRDYLFVVDYFLKYFEVICFFSKNSEVVIMVMKDMFVCYGILERFIVDNMFFNSVKFKDFVNKWEFEVVIFSLYYLKFNGFVERNV